MRPQRPDRAAQKLELCGDLRAASGELLVLMRVVVGAVQLGNALIGPLQLTVEHERVSVELGQSVPDACTLIG